MNIPKIAYKFNGIQWNEVTWYSKLTAIFFCFGVVPALSFYVGSQYQLTLTAIQSSGELSFEMKTLNVQEDASRTYFGNIRVYPSNQGPRLVIAFTLDGNRPTPKEKIVIDLVDPQTGDSVAITKPLQMGFNEIDLNSDALPTESEQYLLRAVYYVPGGALGDTRVVALSRVIKIK